jgi:hypothetical protein
VRFSEIVEPLFEFPTKLTPEVLAIGGLFAVSIGILFGYYPARKHRNSIPFKVFATNDRRTRTLIAGGDLPSTNSVS